MGKEKGRISLCTKCEALKGTEPTCSSTFEKISKKVLAVFGAFDYTVLKKRSKLRETILKRKEELELCVFLLILLR